MKNDLLQACSRELRGCQDLFAMPAPVYEASLNELANRLDEYRLNLIEAAEMLTTAYSEGVGSSRRHRYIMQAKARIINGKVI